jgi:hypothetical protein
MVQLIPARIEDGKVVPNLPLPATGAIQSVSILVEVAEPSCQADRAAALSRLRGILKENVGDAREEYRRYLEEKYR